MASLNSTVSCSLPARCLPCFSSAASVSVLLRKSSISIKMASCHCGYATCASISWGQQCKRPLMPLCDPRVLSFPSHAKSASASSVEVPEKSTTALLRKGEDAFAVVMIGSCQYIVFPGRLICTQKLKGAEIDAEILLNRVLLVGTRSKTYIGDPIVKNAVVHAVVKEQGWDKEIIVFKFKRKKHYRRTLFHRQALTKIMITGISGYDD